MIETVRHNEFCFVFGSNRLGKHDAGAAKCAATYYGAEDGVGKGFTGGCYALPTKDKNLKTLHPSIIQEEISDLIRCAKAHATTKFMLTRIGCGLAGYRDDDILSLIKPYDLPENIMLPGKWLEMRGELEKPRVIIAGGRDFSDYTMLKARCRRVLSRLEEGGLNLVSGCTQGADSLGEKYFSERKEHNDLLKLTRFPALWDEYGNAAGGLRNSAMAFYGTHLIAFDTGGVGTRDMIRKAKNDGLNVRIINCHKNNL